MIICLGNHIQLENWESQDPSWTHSEHERMVWVGIIFPCQPPTLERSLHWLSFVICLLAHVIAKHALPSAHSITQILWVSMLSYFLPWGLCSFESCCSLPSRVSLQPWLIVLSVTIVSHWQSETSLFFLIFFQIIRKLHLRLEIICQSSGVTVLLNLGSDYASEIPKIHASSLMYLLNECVSLYIMCTPFYVFAMILVIEYC